MTPEMITMPAHETNMWSRNGQRIEYIVLHYVGAVSTAVNNGHYYGTEPNIGASAHYFVDEHSIVASVPEFTMRTRSIEGIASVIFSASTTSASQGAP